MALVRGESSNPNEPAVHGKSTAQDQGMGIMGEAARGSGVIGVSTDWIGVYGESENFEGVRGTSKNKDHAGVVGINEGGGTALYGKGTAGLQAIGQQWVGVYGETQADASVGAAGVWGEGKNGGDGVKGHASGPGKAGVAGFHLTNNGPGIFGQGNPAGRFIGNVEVTGNITVSGIGFSVILARLAALEQLVAQHISQASTGTAPTTGDPVITVSQPAGSKMTVKGSNFKSNAQVRIRLVVGSIGNEASVNTSSSGNGSFDHTFPVTGIPAGTPIWVSATDGTSVPTSVDITGFRWSNTVQVTFTPT